MHVWRQCVLLLDALFPHRIINWHGNSLPFYCSTFQRGFSSCYWRCGSRVSVSGFSVLIAVLCSLSNLSFRGNLIQSASSYSTQPTNQLPPTSPANQSTVPFFALAQRLSMAQCSLCPVTLLSPSWPHSSPVFLSRSLSLSVISCFIFLVAGHPAGLQRL